MNKASEFGGIIEFIEKTIPETTGFLTKYNLLTDNYTKLDSILLIAKRDKLDYDEELKRQNRVISSNTVYNYSESDDCNRYNQSNHISYDSYNSSSYDSGSSNDSDFGGGSFGGAGSSSDW